MEGLDTDTLVLRVASNESGGLGKPEVMAEAEPDGNAPAFPFVEYGGK